MKILALIATALLLSSCTWIQSWWKPAPTPFCDTTAKMAAPAVATLLNCKNPDAITADLNKMMSDKGVCKAQMQAGTVGVIVCPMIATYTVSFANNQLPPAWGCNIAGTSIPVVKYVQDICEAAVTF